MPRMSFDRACASFVHRYTMEHKPAWASKPCSDGKFYAPQYATDREWYDNTTFPGEPGHLGDDHAYSTGQTWPLGIFLDAPFMEHPYASR